MDNPLRIQQTLFITIKNLYPFYMKLLIYSAFLFSSKKVLCRTSKAWTHSKFCFYLGKIVMWENPLFLVRNLNEKTKSFYFFFYQHFFSEKKILSLKFTFLFPFQVWLVGRKYARIIVNHLKSLREIERNITRGRWLSIMFLFMLSFM